MSIKLFFFFLFFSVFVFRPDEAKPVYQKASVSEECVFYAAFIPHPSHKTDLPPQLQWQTKSQLYFMNKSQELLTIEENADDHISLKRPSTVSVCFCFVFCFFISLPSLYFIKHWTIFTCCNLDLTTKKCFWKWEKFNLFGDLCFSW